MKQEPYKVTSSTFKGTCRFNGEVIGYTYEITFNKSLVHTGRFEGIENGLNAYEKRERVADILESGKSFLVSIWVWIKSLL